MTAKSILALITLLTAFVVLVLIVTLPLGGN